MIVVIVLSTSTVLVKTLITLDLKHLLIFLSTNDLHLVHLDVLSALSLLSFESASFFSSTSLLVSLLISLARLFDSFENIDRAFEKQIADELLRVSLELLHVEVDFALIRVLLLQLLDVGLEELIRVPISLILDHRDDLSLFGWILLSVLKELLSKEDCETDKNIWLILQLIEEASDTHFRVNIGPWIGALELTDIHLD